MAAAPDSPMHKDLYDRLQQIALEDNEREEKLGRPLPSRLKIYLSGGHVIDDCYLLDGENSLDDASIDVKRDEDGLDAVYIVPLGHIAAIYQTYPDRAGEP
jgi:hypothetical protein